MKKFFFSVFKLILALFVTFCPAYLIAQNGFFNFGISPSMSNRIMLNDQENNMQFMNTINFSAGYTVFMGEHLAMGWGINQISKGYAIKGDIYEGDTFQGWRAIHYKYNYIGFPFKLYYYPLEEASFRPYITASVSGMFMYSYKVKHRYSDDYILPKTDDYGVSGFDSIVKSHNSLYQPSAIIGMGIIMMEDAVGLGVEPYLHYSFFRPVNDKQYGDFRLYNFGMNIFLLIMF